jgi:SAM-dependent methyltransferase
VYERRERLPRRGRGAERGDDLRPAWNNPLHRFRVPARIVPMSVWPQGFERIPDEDWTTAPVESLAEKYDKVDEHGWYRNLDPTVADLAAFAAEGAIVLDYSGGTGILIDRLLEIVGNRALGIVNVDSSPKFLRLSLEKFRSEERVAFRLIRFLKDERRLQFVDEVLGRPLLDRRVDGLVSANAIHLYYDLADTLASWRRVLRADGRAFVQSGNIGVSEPGLWIIDATVVALQQAAEEIVLDDERFSAHRDRLSDETYMRAHTDFARKVFPPVRPLDEYLAAFRAAALEPVDVTVRPVEAHVADWRDFLAVYHEGILGWVGGAEKVTGEPASAEAVADRQELLALAFDRLFQGETFEAAWTYLTLRPV